MQTVFSVMTDVFNQVKMSGSYFLLYILAAFFLVYKNREKYKWNAMFALACFVLVYGNPIVVLILGKIFPVLQTYTPFLLFVPVFLYVPMAVVEQISIMWEEKKRYVMVVLFILIIAISGSFFGLGSAITKAETTPTGEQKEVLTFLDKAKGQNILAEDGILPFIPLETEGCKCLYGRDLWTPNMDLGIMDSYPEELTGLYEAMKNPGDTLKDILQTAMLFDCDYIVMKRFKNYPAYEGNYTLAFKTENYLVYQAKTTE